MFNVVFYLLVIIFVLPYLFLIVSAFIAGFRYEFDNEGIHGSSAWLRDRK
jgi:hypothetical protein